MALNGINGILVVLVSVTVTSSVCCRRQNVAEPDHIFDSLLSREEKTQA